MLFARDTIDALVAAAALVNTVPAASNSGADELRDPALLAAFLDLHSYSGRRDGDASELADVRRLRSEIATLWTASRDDAVARVNAMLEDGAARPQLRRHDGLDWHLHATEAEAPLAERMRVEVAMAFVDIIRSDEGSRLRSCEADDCEAVLVDLSRNRSKRFCDVGNCGNRMNVTAYRARRSGATG